MWRLWGRKGPGDGSNRVQPKLESENSITKRFLCKGDRPGGWCTA